MTKSYRNLLQRLAKPALGNGRIQKGCKRAFWAHNAPITTSIAIEFAYALQLVSEKPRRAHYYATHHALESLGCVRVARASTQGRPWLWRWPSMQHDATWK